MIKKLHEIVLRDVILLDATKSANVLKKHWFIPLFLCRKELEVLAKQIFDAIGGKTVDDLQDQFDRLKSYRRLQLLEALWKAVQIEFELKGRIGAWKIILGKDLKESPQLEEVLAAVLKHTGIKLETPEDLKTLSEYVQHKVDKFEEMFPEPDAEMNAEIKAVQDSQEYATLTSKEREDLINGIRDKYKKEVSLVKILNSVFLHFNLSPNENMLLITWIGMKEEATNKAVQQSNTEENELC